MQITCYAPGDEGLPVFGHIVPHHSEGPPEVGVAVHQGLHRLPGEGKYNIWYDLLFIGVAVHQGLHRLPGGGEILHVIIVERGHFLFIFVIWCKSYVVDSFMSYGM